jgi:hypothetical protein
MINDAVLQKIALTAQSFTLCLTAFLITSLSQVMNRFSAMVSKPQGIHSPISIVEGIEL